MGQAVIQNSLLTIFQRIDTANDVLNSWASSNVFVSIGQQTLDAANDTLVPIPNDSQDYLNQIYRNSIALKKITAASMALMIPRVDWQNGTTYNYWDDTKDMWTTVALTQLPGTINVNNSRTVTGLSTFFQANLSQGQLIYVTGDGINVAPQTLQVTDIFSNTSMNVNTAFTGNIVGNSIFTYIDSFPNYAQNWYVRNIYDQIFICLYNGGGVPSNTMPMLTIGGDLPTDPFIITADGYYWKYMYTIPSGNKQQFFSPNYMPVYSDPATVQSAVNGRIDVVLILNSGSGYNQNVASNSATILQVTGDGTGCNLTAVTNSTGAIVGINVLNGGQGYTYANVTANTGTTGGGASFRPIIGPQGGHGFDPVHELGASTLMVSLDLVGNEANTLPTGVTAGTGQFEFHQVAILEAPILSSGNVASNTNYSMVTQISVQTPPSGKFFSLNETVYQGTISNQTFSGTVVYWDATNDLIWLNNITGTFTPQAPIQGTLETSPVTAFVLQAPPIVPYTGKILYMNNVLPIVRGPNQTEQIRLLIEY